jgi:HEAT repeat protein
VPLAALCLAVAFHWPGEVHKTMERVRTNPFSATYQDIQTLKNASTPEADRLLVSLLDRDDQGTRMQAARALAELERTRWQPVTGEGGLTLEDELVDWLDLTDPVMRRTACELLGKVGATDQRERVAMMVTDADLEVRAVCVRTLLALYLGSEDVEPVRNMTVQLLSDPYFEVRRSAVVGLGHLGVEGTFVAFLPLIESDDPTIRKLAIEAVVRIDPEAAAPVVEKALFDSDYEVRVAALRALGDMGDPGVLDLVEPLLGDPAIDVHVVAALSRLPGPEVDRLLLELIHVPRLRPAALNALAVQDEVSAGMVAERLLTTTDPEILRVLVVVAGLHPDVEHLPGLERVIGVLPDARMEVLDVLAGLEEREALLMTLSMTTGSTPKVRARALEVAGTILEARGGDPAAADVVIDALCDQDLAVRLQAVELVARWRFEDAAPLLVPLVDSQVESERVAAAAALLALGETYPVEMLVDTLLAKDARHGLAAAAALGEHRPAAALDLIVDRVDGPLLDDPPAGFALAVEVLGTLLAERASERAGALLERMLSDEDVEVRALGARAAAMAGGAGRTARLSSMMVHDTTAVRAAVAPLLWHVAGEEGRALIATALADDDAMVRALAVLSLDLSSAFDDASKVDLCLEALADPDELVRINAAAALRARASRLEDRTERLCDAYDRNMTGMEMISGVLLLAEAGAPCLSDRLERLVFAPSAASRAVVFEGVRIGRSTGAVELTDRLRAGLGACAVAAGSRRRGICRALLEEPDAEVEECQDWSVLGGSLKNKPDAQGWTPAAQDGAEGALFDDGELLPGVYTPRMQTPVSDGGPVFVVDGALTLRATVYAGGRAHALPPPRCGPYRGFNVLAY